MTEQALIKTKSIHLLKNKKIRREGTEFWEEKAYEQSENPGYNFMDQVK